MAQTDSVDLTGRKQLATNIVASWAAQLIHLATGFILPRMIDGHLGQDILGAWDFAWSVVAYFSLVQVGVVGSVNRYVALHRASGDTEGVNRTVSSVTCMLVIMGVTVAMLTIGTALLVPYFMAAKVGPFVQELRWTILFLGIGMAIQTACSGYGGVLTGCHCWGLHNAVHAGGYVVTAVGMIVALLLGGGLRSLACVHFCGETMAWLVRCVLAYRVCPGLSVRAAHVRWDTARSMLRFGGKAFLPQIAELFLNQSINILVAAYLGTAALAQYARPRSLVLQTRMLVFKMAAVLLPSVSSLLAKGRHADIEDLVIKSARYAAYMILPVTAMLMILGGPVLHLWMGPRYVQPSIILILSAGYAGMIIQIPVIAILGGLNLHGRPAIVHLVASLCTTVAVLFVLGPLKLGLVWAALAATGPLALVHALYVPFYTCRRLGISLRQYMVGVFLGPTLLVLPYAVALGVIRVLLADKPDVAVLAGAGVGMVLLPAYWRWALPESLKAQILNLLRRMNITAASRAAAAPDGSSTVAACPPSIDAE